MGDPHDRLKIVQAFEPDLAHARNSRIAASSFGGFRTPAAGVAASFFKRPASETLHNSDGLDR
jgi:hypothetical protein